MLTERTQPFRAFPLQVPSRRSTVTREPIIEFIDQQDWVKEAADAVQGPIRDAFQQLGPAKDFLHGKWLGHALHPVLTDIPIGAWTTALALDAVQMLTGSDGMA